MKVNVLGTGWDPEYYSSGVRISFDQNFGNGVLTPIADEIVVPPDSDGRFSFTYTIPEGFQQGNIISISGLIGNGGGERANFTVTGGIQEGGGSAVAEPDLQPTAIKYDASAVRLNNPVHFDAGIKNNGQKDTSSFNIKWLVDGEDVGAYGSHAGVPGATTVLDGNSQFDWTPKDPGSHLITFSVDADNHVAETKETNNSESVTVTVEGSKSTQQSAPAPITEQVVSSRIWSGYAFSNEPIATYTYVKGSWIEPKVNCPTPTVPGLSKVGIWVGLSGAKLAQVGTVTTCAVGSSPRRNAFYEVVPNKKNTTIESRVVEEGDRLTAEVTYRKGRYYFVLTNHTRHWEHKEHFDSKNDTPSAAECIVERPLLLADIGVTKFNWLYPLPDFGKLTFSGCTADGVTDGDKPITGGNIAQAVQLVQTGSLSRGTYPLAKPDGLCYTSSNTYRFSVKWLETGLMYNANPNESVGPENQGTVMSLPKC